MRPTQGEDRLFGEHQAAPRQPAGPHGVMAGVTGLEPATSGVTGRRSNQLSYTPEALAPRRRQILCRTGGVNAAMRGSQAVASKVPQWWAMTGSNRRHSRCKRDALPLS